MEILAPSESNRLFLSRTFHVARANAGFLGLGAKIEVLVDGQVVDTTVVYGDTLHAIRLHVDAQAGGDTEEMAKTNSELPRRFQYPIDLVVSKT